MANSNALSLRVHYHAYSALERHTEAQRLLILKDEDPSTDTDVKLDALEDVAVKHLKERRILKGE